MTTTPGPLMSGTRLFLNALLLALYAAAFIIGLATLVVVVLMFRPTAGISFAAADNLMMISVFAFLLLAIAFFRNLRDIVRSVAEGDPFNRDNPARLNRLAVLSALLWAADLVYMFWDVMSGAGPVSPDTYGALAAEAINHVFSLIGPVTLFILARVFKHGATMREDLEGTV